MQTQKIICEKHIFFKLEQAGIYWCEMGDIVGLIHYLHIDSEAEDLYSNITSHMPQMALVEIMDYKLKIYTTWTLWSPCSVCNAVGIKLRYGYCTISLLETSVNRYFIDKSILIIDKYYKMQR